MKKLSFFALLVFTSVMACGQNIAINDNGTAADASAILDVNTYGASKKGMLIPRMTSAERTAIASPANGLLVYDATLNSMMIFSSGIWREVVQSNNNFWQNSGATTYNILTQPVSITNSSLSAEGQLNVLKTSATVTGIETILTIQRETSGTAANGIGGAIVFRNQVDNGGVGIAGRLASIAENASVGTSRHAFQFNVYAGGIGTTQLYMNPDGVSIGSGSLPQSKLHVFSDGTITGGIRITNTTPATTGSSLLLEGAAKSWAIMATNNGASAGTNKLLFRDHSLGLNRMLIDGAGNVGIGTDVPDVNSKLDVAGNINFTGTLKVNGSNGNTGDILVSNGASAPTWQSLKTGSRAYLSSNLALVSGVFTTLTSFTEVFDDGASFNPVTGGYTIPVDGLYTLAATVTFAASPALANVPVQLRFLRNGSIFTGCQVTDFINPNGSYSDAVFYTTTLKFSAGDVITVSVVQNAGANHTILGSTGSGTTIFTVKREY